MLTPCTQERANCWNTESRAPCDSCVVQLALAASASGTGKSRWKDVSKKGRGMNEGMDGGERKGGWRDRWREKGQRKAVRKNKGERRKWRGMNVRGDGRMHVLEMGRR